MLRECCSAKKIPLSLPISQDTVTKFILWLAFDKKVSSATISVYLAGIRQLHIQHGIAYPDIKSEYIKMLLRGKKNSESCSTADKQGDKRRPVTPEVLMRIKAGLTNSLFTICDKRMIWSACTILFSALSGLATS